MSESVRPVHVLADPTVEEAARSAGCGFSPWRRAPHMTSLDPDEDVLKDWELGNPLALIRRMRDDFLGGPAADYAADTAEAVEEVLEEEEYRNAARRLGAAIDEERRAADVVQEIEAVVRGEEPAS